MGVFLPRYVEHREVVTELLLREVARGPGHEEAGADGVEAALRGEVDAFVGADQMVDEHVFEPGYGLSGLAAAGYGELVEEGKVEVDRPEDLLLECRLESVDRGVSMVKSLD